MLAILKDAKIRSGQFCWFGPIERGEIESWMKLAGFSVPSELVELWSLTGGGDLFDDGETIFRPTATGSTNPAFIPACDDIYSANEHRIRNGMSKSYLAFHDGTFLSAIRLTDQKIVTLNQTWRETGIFSGLDNWYLRTLRASYADVYNLPANLN
jgi:hypothetical protein